MVKHIHGSSSLGSSALDRSTIAHVCVRGSGEENLRRTIIRCTFPAPKGAGPVFHLSLYHRRP